MTFIFFEDMSENTDKAIQLYIDGAFPSISVLYDANAQHFSILLDTETELFSVSWPCMATFCRGI